MSYMQMADIMFNGATLDQLVSGPRQESHINLYDGTGTWDGQESNINPYDSAGTTGRQQSNINIYRHDSTGTRAGQESSINPFDTTGTSASEDGEHYETLESSCSIARGIATEQSPGNYANTRQKKTYTRYIRPCGTFPKRTQSNNCVTKTDDERIRIEPQTLQKQTLIRMKCRKRYILLTLLFGLICGFVICSVCWLTIDKLKETKVVCEFRQQTNNDINDISVKPTTTHSTVMATQYGKYTSEKEQYVESTTARFMATTTLPNTTSRVLANSTPTLLDATNLERTTSGQIMSTYVDTMLDDLAETTQITEAYDTTTMPAGNIDVGSSAEPRYNETSTRTATTIANSVTSIGGHNMSSNSRKLPTSTYVSSIIKQHTTYSTVSISPTTKQSSTITGDDHHPRSYSTFTTASPPFQSSIPVTVNEPSSTIETLINDTITPSAIPATQFPSIISSTTELSSSSSSVSPSSSEDVSSRSASTTPPSTTEGNQIDTRSIQGGYVYIRWGRWICASTAAQIYKGYAAGGHWQHSGGATNTICLPEVPTWGNYSDTAENDRNLVYGTEYGSTDESFSKTIGKKLRNKDVPCSVCQAIGRPSHVMVPGKTDCFSGWTLEYRGYLMGSGYIQNHASELICVDSSPDHVTGSDAVIGGNFLYLAEVRTGSLPSSAYVNGRELSCVVCTL